MNPAGKMTLGLKIALLALILFMVTLPLKGTLGTILGFGLAIVGIAGIIAHNIARSRESRRE